MKTTDLSGTRKTLFIGLFLVLVTAGVYGQVKDHDFILLDDTVYITDNPAVKKGFSADNLIRLLTYGNAAEVNPWHPLTMVSLMLDYRLYGPNPAGYHLTNVVLHILNALLLFLIFDRMTRAPWRSAFVAALFALHPLHVESVAWAAERKDVLSTFFELLAIAAYLAYAARPNARRYLAVFLLYGLSLAAKPMPVTLPLVLLLLDYWPLGRLRIGPAVRGKVRVLRRRTGRGGRVRPLPADGAKAPGARFPGLPAAVLEKIPLLGLAFLAGAITLYSQGKIGAVDMSIPLSMRLGNAAVSYAAYVYKTFLPHDMAVLYPYAESLPAGPLLAVLVLLSGVTLAAFRCARRFPWFFVGWSWYGVTLLPVIGIVQAGRQAMADRYTYVPLIGLFVIVAWGAARLAEVWRIRPVWTAAAAAAVLSVLAVVAWNQVALWKNGLSLFEHTLAVTSGNGTIHRCLADTLMQAGRIDEAAGHYREAVRLLPQDSEAWNRLGFALRRQGRDGEALVCFLEAVRWNPDNYRALSNAGSLMASQGRLADAAPYFREALRIRPDYPEAGIGWAEVLRASGRPEEALARYEAMLRVRADVPEMHYNAGTILASFGRLDEAAAYFERALALRPGYAKAHNNLGNILMMKGRRREAVAHFRRAVEIDPQLEAAQDNLKEALAAGKRGRE